ncbi:glycosyltransferase family protein [Pseudanabaena mucicola]|uniref:Glycosyltransferase n=1 Tax=Pseudanabaena mucicola FACHB-723 TaxID=2692860 RepID=A0ABR7ZZQ2_9CYAN|nr:hypothetical protein [Pseudanabaena mucicola]MBD2189069.1 hypothetical protein [Pseudanabaena mucicola FACHB-723]
MQTVVVIDIRWTGHHPTYANFVTQAFLQSNYQVVVLCPNPNEMYESIRLSIPEKAGNLIVETLIDVQLSPIKKIKKSTLLLVLYRWYEALKRIKKASKKYNFDPDFVFFNYFDDYIYFAYPTSSASFKCRLLYDAINFVFPYKWLGIVFHTGSEDKLVNPNMYKILDSKKCQSFSVLNEKSAEKLRFLNKRIVILPDTADVSLPSSIYPVAQQIKEKANGRPIIGLLGALHKRKGVLPFIEIVKKLSNYPYFFLLAGILDRNSFSPDELGMITEFCDSDPENLFFFFERIPIEANFNSLVSQCDILYLVYECFASSSNIMTKAAFFNKPVLVAHGYLMETLVKEFNLGLSASNQNIEQQIECLETILNKEKFLSKVGQPKFEDFRLLTSREKFNTNLLSLFDDLG